ncbi:putative transcription factor C2H2 family [Helianthus anomalus]
MYLCSKTLTLMSSLVIQLKGKRQPTCNKVTTLVDQVNLIRTKFVYQALFHMKRNYTKFVYRLIAKWTNSDSYFTIIEQCTICFEYIHNDQIYTVPKCLHRYCFSCMRQHVEAKLLQGKLPECPHEKCESKIRIEGCKKFLNPELYDIMRLRVKEASILPKDRVYCPFSKCSAFMSKTEVIAHTPSSSSTAAGDTGMRRCVECNRLFCINCKVPWHDGMTCSGYMKSYVFQSSNEAKLKSLATKERWRECINCKNLVELTSGCYHIDCRCGYQFCYTCGAEWVDKKQTCGCRLWDEHNIIYA